jgi:hypothetical protein
MEWGDAVRGRRAHNVPLPTATQFEPLRGSDADRNFLQDNPQQIASVGAEATVKLGRPHAQVQELLPLMMPPGDTFPISSVFDLFLHRLSRSRSEL